MQANLTIELEEVKETISKIAPQEIKNQILNFKLAMMKCQSGVTGYKIVANNCYFFDNVKRLRAEAILNCALKFPSGGRFIEPRTVQLFELIEEISILYFSSDRYVWLGVEYSREKDAFIYSSDGAPIVIKKWYDSSAAQPLSNWNQKRNENNYCTFGLKHKGWFNNFHDSNKEFSICEPK